jgi:hypothetical protein
MSRLCRLAIATAVGLYWLGSASSIAIAQQELSFSSNLPDAKYWLTSALDNKREHRKHTLSYHGASYLALLDPKNDAFISKIFGDDPDRNVRDANKRLLRGEFYTGLRLEDFLNQDAFHDICNQSRRSKHWFLTVKMSVTYTPQEGDSPVNSEQEVVPESVILVMGTIDHGSSTKGCTFRSIHQMQTLPYLTYNGFGVGQGEYKLHFKVASGTVNDRKSLVAALVKTVQALEQIPIRHDHSLRRRSSSCIQLVRMPSGLG